MITKIRPTLTVSSDLFDEAIDVINRSGADERLENIYGEWAGVGGRRATGIRYSIRGFLTAALLCVSLKRPPTIAGVLQMLADFTVDQLAAVGMGGQDLSVVRTESSAEYGKFHAWVSRRLEPIDPDRDLPARRITNAENQRIIDRRSEADREALQRSRDLLSEVVNDIVKGSVWELAPAGCVGDLVVDESIYDLARHTYGLGVALDRRRGAAPGSRPYGRDHKHNLGAGDGKKALRKSGIGIGLTALTRVGEPHRLNSVAPVIIGIDVHAPTSGDPGAVLRALGRARENNLTARSATSRARWPYLTVDMGYNSKKGFADAMIRQQYAYVGRYPQKWGTVHASAPAKLGQQQPGPVMVAGDLYCPAAAKIASTITVPPARDLLKASPAGFADHDRRLQRILPLLMGRNSRPVHGSVQRGPKDAIRPRAADTVKVRVVCPAAFERVRCPLRPTTMALSGDLPTLEPTWTPQQYACCEKGTITIGLTPDQVRMGQFGMTPGSWEHMLYYEAARSLTERQFSVLKSRTVTGLADLTVGPRRQPMIAINLAMAVAVTNLATQRAHDERRPRGGSIRRRLKLLEADLGYPPTMTPART
ncbi:hypothetical protein ASU32_00635 [Tsukamurella tyrosinosolvens]|nr:hypothetical protein ASU32_00635 [Tsukamurella tyrosinosolvens]